MVKGVNTFAGYRVLDERVSPDWAYGKFVAEDPMLHNASKLLGGTGLMMLAGGGLGRAAGAATGGTGAAGGAGGAVGLSGVGGGTMVLMPAAAAPAVVTVGAAGVGAGGGAVVGVGGQIYAMLTGAAGGGGGGANKDLLHSPEALIPNR